MKKILLSLGLILCHLTLSAKPYFSEYHEHGFIIVFHGDVSEQNILNIKVLERKYVEEMISLTYKEADVRTELENMGVMISIIKHDPNTKEADFILPKTHTNDPNMPYKENPILPNR